MEHGMTRRMRVEASNVATRWMMGLTAVAVISSTAVAQAQSAKRPAQQSGEQPAGVEAIVNDAKAAAEASQRAAQQQKSQGAAKKKTTDVSFDDVLVQGKFHFSDEAVTTVEQDKVLDALLGVRTDFKDRIRKSSSRY